MSKIVSMFAEKGSHPWNDGCKPLATARLNRDALLNFLIQSINSNFNFHSVTSGHFRINAMVTLLIKGSVEP